MIRIFSHTGSTTLNLGNSFTQGFNLNNNGRSFSLRRLTWDFNLRNAATNLQVNNYTQVDIVSQLRIGAPGGQRISYSFENFTVPAAIQYNGDSFSLWTPGVYAFSDWNMSDALPFSYQFNNFTAATSYYINFTIICEIDDITK